MLATDRDARPRDGAAVLAALEEIESAMWEAPTVAVTRSSEVRSTTAVEERGPIGTLVMPRAVSKVRGRGDGGDRREMAAHRIRESGHHPRRSNAEHRPRWSHTCPTCAWSEAGEKQAKIDAMTKDLGPVLKHDIAKSPTMQNELAQLHDEGWTVKVDNSLYNAGYSNFASKQIVIGPQDASGDNGWGFAHEVGHAMYHESGGFSLPSMDGTTKGQWVSGAISSQMKDEGEATFNQYQFRNEVLTNSGRDVGGLGPTYDSIYDDYQAGHITQDQAATQMGNQYRNMATSVTEENYGRFYGDADANAWDAAHPPPPPPPPPQPPPPTTDPPNTDDPPWWPYPDWTT
jgi:hypothetical protein